jgi:hypothetical protein
MASSAPEHGKITNHDLVTRETAESRSHMPQPLLPPQRGIKSLGVTTLTSKLAISFVLLARTPGAQVLGL